MQYETGLIIDLVTIAACLSALVPLGRISHLHPATVYLVFHLFTFTTRLWGLQTGSQTLYAPPMWDQRFEPVREEEICRAILLADAALVSMTLAWVLAAFRDRSAKPKLGRWSEILLNPRIVQPVGGITAVVGVVGLILFSNVPGVRSGPMMDATSSWLTLTPTWVGLALLSFIYLYGFKPRFLVPMAGYLLVMAVQGYHRVRVIIPALLMVQIYLDARGLKWPRIGGVLVFAAMILAFFPMKMVGKAVQSGASLERILEESSDVIGETLEGKADDHFFLDEFASTLTLVDANDKLYWGSPYLALLTLPIPRAFWEGKPSTADFIADFSRPWRPMAQDGMIVTMLGEAYANFGYAGIFLIPPLIGYLLAMIYFRAQRAPFLSLSRFSYTLVACNLIQVYRDGLVSLFVFTIVNMLPLVVMIVFHRTMHRSPRARGAPAAAMT